MLVTDHASLSLQDLDGLSKPFLNFIDILKVQTHINDPDQMRKFFDSVALVVTKAEKDIDFYDYKL